MTKNRLYEIAYDEAVRALSEQQSAIDNFRARAGLLFSVATIIASFFGSQVLGSAGLSPFSWLALASFGFLATAFIGILSPRRWEVTVDPLDVISAYLEPDESHGIEDVHRGLATAMNESYSVNRQGLEKLVVLFQTANVLLVCEVVLWTIALASAS